MSNTSELIKEGDEILNEEDSVVTITSVEPGEHGLLIKGDFASGIPYMVYVPLELPTEEATWDWYGWTLRGFIMTRRTKFKLGALSLWRDDPCPHTIEAYDAKYLDSLKQMEAERCQLEATM